MAATTATQWPAIDGRSRNPLPTSVEEPTVVPWTRVREAVYAVRVHYRYEYPSPVTNLQHRLMVVPPSHHRDQVLLDHMLFVHGTRGYVPPRWEKDAAGNRVVHVTAARVERAIGFEASYRVRRRVNEADTTELTAAQAARLLEPTALTMPDQRLRAAAAAIAASVPEGRDRRALVEAAHRWAGKALVSESGVTTYQTPASEALRLGKGVCQDYAHVLLAVLRLLGIPARYVSGQLLGEGPSHAWVEALLRDERSGAVEILALDPSHQRHADLSYITVAIGRDFADVTPTSGTFQGAGGGQLTYTKQTDVVSLETDEGSWIAIG